MFKVIFYLILGHGLDNLIINLFLTFQSLTEKSFNFKLHNQNKLCRFSINLVKMAKTSHSYWKFHGRIRIPKLFLTFRLTCSTTATSFPRLLFEVLFFYCVWTPLTAVVLPSIRVFIRLMYLAVFELISTQVFVMRKAEGYITHGKGIFSRYVGLRNHCYLLDFKRLSGYGEQDLRKFAKKAYKRFILGLISFAELSYQSVVVMVGLLNTWQVCWRGNQELGRVG